MILVIHVALAGVYGLNKQSSEERPSRPSAMRPRLYNSDNPLGRTRAGANASPMPKYRRLFALTAATSVTPGPSLWASLAFWRGLAATAVAALAIYVAIAYISPPAPQLHTRLVASLAADGSDVKYLAV